MLVRTPKGTFILTPQLCCGAYIHLTYIDYISAASHHSITTFQVKMNLTFMRHRSAVTLKACAVWQRNALAV